MESSNRANANSQGAENAPPPPEPPPPLEEAPALLPELPAFCAPPPLCPSGPDMLVLLAAELLVASGSEASDVTLAVAFDVPATIATALTVTVTDFDTAMSPKSQEIIPASVEEHVPDVALASAILMFASG